MFLGVFLVMILIFSKEVDFYFEFFEKKWYIRI